MVSPDAFHKQLVRLGLPLNETGDFYDYSLALDAREPSPPTAFWPRATGQR